MDLLRNLKGVHTELEIFNKSITPDSAATRYIAKRIQESKTVSSLPASFANAYYEEAWKYLNDFHAQYLSDRILAFKIIYNQLPPEFIHKLVSTPDTLTVLLERNPLDCLISFIKAKMLNIWSMQDTTNVEIDLNEDDILKLCHIYNERVKQCEIVKNKLDQNAIRYTTLHYEELTAFSNDIKQQVQIVSDRLGLDMNPQIQTVFVKQDKGDNKILKEKVKALLSKENFTWFSNDARHC